MAWSEQRIDVDRELELTVDVMESGVVRLQLTGGAVKAELGPGDRYVLALRPVKMDETQSKPAVQETWNSHVHGSDYFENDGGATAAEADDSWGGAADAVEPEDVSDSSRD
jgi:hypothetical protein